MLLIMYIFMGPQKKSSLQPANTAIGEEHHCQLEPGYPDYEEIVLPIQRNRIGNEQVDLTQNPAYGKI